MKKIVISVLVMIVSQSLMAKISDFNSLIAEQSKSQNEIYNSIKAEEKESEVQNINPDDNDKKPEVIVLDTNSEVFSQPENTQKTIKKSNKSKKISKSKSIEEKHFIRLGEELNEAR